MGRFQITATITNKHGKVLSRAQNSYTKTHPIQAKFARSSLKPDRIYLHAEIAALVSLKEKGAHKIFIERYTKDGKPANAMPCDVCQAAIKAWNIQLVEYTC